MGDVAVGVLDPGVVTVALFFESARDCRDFKDDRVVKRATRIESA
ncbi:MAG: hypothetical protein ACRDQU_02040 [Pseudonocardiaceae bacterium]